MSLRTVALAAAVLAVVALAMNWDRVRPRKARG